VAGARGEGALAGIRGFGARERAQARVQRIEAGAGAGGDRTVSASASSGECVEQVGLVVDPQAARHIGDRVGDGGAACLRISRIEHDDRQVRALQFVARAAHAFAFDRIAAFAQARRCRRA
jgi:hypothetical protein